MSKQYVDVSGWEDPAPQKQYVDVNGWDNAAPKEEKGIIRRVVDGVTAPFKAVASAYAKDQEVKPTKPITATEKLELARPLFEMGRRSSEYMKKLERDAELEQGQIKRDEQEKKRTAQIEESKKPALQQLADQFNPMRPITAIPAMVGSIVGGEETGKAIAKEFGGDYQYSSGERDTTFSEANPEYVMAESIIVDPLNTIGAPVKATAEAVKVATKNPLHNAAEEIIQSTTKNLGIDLPKPAVSATPDDEVIAKVIADEYGVPKAKEGNPPADSAPATDINVGHKMESTNTPDVTDMNVGDIRQTPIAEMVPEKKVLGVNEYDELKTNLLKYDDEDSANEIMSRYIRSEDPTPTPTNNIDLATKSDVGDTNIVEIKPSSIVEDPKLEAPESIQNVNVKEPAGNEIDIPFSKGEIPAEVHTLESMQQSVRDAVGETIDMRLSPIMGMITKADIPDAVLKEAGDSAEGIHGFIHEGRAYIVADNIPKEWSASQIRGLVMHEVGVHLRKAGAGDKDFGRIIEAMRGSDDPLIKEAYARVPETTAVHRVDEEALAYLIQTHPDTTIARRVIAWVKQQLIRLSISPSILKMTPQDLSAMAWGAVKRGKYDPAKPNFVMVGDTITHPRPNTEFRIPDFVQELGRLNSGKAEADLAYLKSKHPEVFKNEKEVFKIIRYVLTNTKHIVNGTGANNAILLAKMDDKLGKIGLNRDSIPALVVHALKSSKKSEFTRLLKRQMEGSPTPSLPSSGTAAHGAEAHSSDSSSVASKGDEAGDAVGQILKNSSDEEIVQQPKDESQEVQFSRTQEEPQSAPEGHKTGGFYSVAQKAIETMPNKMNVSAFRNYLKGKGIKNDEMIYGGIEKAIDGKETVTKAEMMEALKNPQMSTKVLDNPKYQEYSLGGENYREELTQLDQEGKKFKSNHWDEKNVLYHVRKQDVEIDGQKTLLIDELQSDWMQAKRKGEKAPDAPYEKTWHEKALRDQIDEAVRKGYDRIAWVDGETQTNRFKMSHSVDRVVYNKDVGIVAGYKDGEQIIYRTATDKELASIIGKDSAQKLIDNEVKPGVYEIKGEALDIGGDGMRGFYDKILPDYARKYIKKWGAEVEKKTLSDGTEVWSFPVTKEMSEDVAMNGQPLYAHGLGAVAGIETDEDGNIVGFNPLMALAGAAAGSMLVSKSVRGAVAKVSARAEKLSDAAARNLIVATIKGADKITAGTITKTVEKIVNSDMADYIIGHKIYRMKDYMKMREEALRSANAGMESAARLHLQLTEFSSEAREAMYEYMSGNKEVILTPELKRAADTFVEKIDGMGKTMVDEGFLSKEAYEEWKGQYLHRRYASKMKQASDWASGKGEFAVDKIQMRGKTWNASEDEYQELLKAGQIGKVSEGKIEVLKDAEGTYKLRRDWSREERSAMGEIRDVAYSLPETIGRMAQMIEFGKMLKSVPSKYILAQEGRADNVMKQLGYEKLSGSRYGALNDKWVNQSIAGDLKRVSNDVMGEEGNVKRMWSDYVSAMKMSHTVYNPTAHVNNVGSNVFLQTAAGLNPILTIKYATDGARAARKAGIWRELDAKRITGLSSKEESILSKLEADEDLTLWRELNDKHMFGRSQLNEMLRTYMSPHVDTAAGSAVHKVSEGAKALYQAEDDVMRFSAIKQLTRDGMWDDSGNGLVKRKMEIDEAMTHVNDTIVPDYTKPMSKLALTLRDSGLVPFMSWTYYSTPILIKQLRDHPTRVMAIAAAWYGLDRLFGVDPYDDESMPKGFAEQRVAVGRDGDKVTGFRVSSMIPHIQLANPANTFLEPLTSGIPQTMLGSATNYNFYFRKPITTKEGGEGAYHRGKDIAMNVLPSPDVFDKAYNLAESKLLDKETRRRDPVFEPRTPAQEAASFFVNLQTYDVSNNRERMRKDKITSGRNDKKWDKKTDDAMRKMERIFQ